ncbi:ArsR/SmtB family transcription factor [Oricola sp.]|uniref:ArsR/SmtB family transcription factor n=1 Tax=Oricola sp. TaxID=1979950 RepID=UPI003BABE96A
MTKQPDRADQFKALASESRLEILRLLDDPAGNFGHQLSADPVKTGVCMQMIAERMGVTQPTISRHIDLLRRAGFLTVTKQQKWHYCARDEAVLAEYHHWLGAEMKVKRQAG